MALHGRYGHQATRHRDSAANQSSQLAQTVFCLMNRMRYEWHEPVLSFRRKLRAGKRNNPCLLAFRLIPPAISKVRFANKAGGPAMLRRLHRRNGATAKLDGWRIVFYPNSFMVRLLLHQIVYGQEGLVCGTSWEASARFRRSEADRAGRHSDFTGVQTRYDRSA